MPPVDRNKPQRANSSESTYSVMEFMGEFPDDQSCLDWLWRRLDSTDGEHAHCPKCNERRKFHRVASRPSYSCDVCGHHIHPTAGTIFHKSSTSLHLWFYAIFLMSSTRCGISAKQLERELGVTYKTAWRMFHLIRNMLMEQDDEPLSGEVEMDETMVGGYRKNAKGRRPTNQSTVFGMVERGGRVVAHVVNDASHMSLFPHISKTVESGSRIFTDEHQTYMHMPKARFAHEAIKHRDDIFVDGDVHTQTIENFWALVKNGIKGVYHNVSPQHLQGYLNEYVFRYNHRDDVIPMFFAVLGRIRRQAA